MMRFAQLAFLLLASACFSSNAVPCANDLTCPAGTQCDDVHARCVTPAEAAVCRDSADGTPCKVGDLAGLCDQKFCIPTCGDGVQQTGEECDCGGTALTLAAGCAAINGDPASSCSAVCHLRFCGNGVVDPGELCDDGNEDNTDHCGLNCQSNVTCGNGLIDYAVGEICDDGNLESHDGCSSICAPEGPSWQTLPGAFVGRAYQAAAYYTSSPQLVMFGGITPTGFDNTTWLFNGSLAINDWSHPLHPAAATARSEATMAFDADHSTILLFGGWDGNHTVLADTWKYTFDTGWTQLAPAASPSARRDAAMVWDGTRHRIVLYGGQDQNAILGDTWEFDGSTWTQLSAGSPPPRAQHALAWDPGRRKIVMFGGLGRFPAERGETWELDSATGQWADVTATAGSAPPARYAHAMAFVASMSTVVLFGGSGIDTVGALADTWEYDGTWKQNAAGRSPPGRFGHTLTYDPDAGPNPPTPVGAAILVGGTDDAQLFADVWEYELVGVGPLYAHAWVAHAPQITPQPGGAVAVFLPGRGTTVQINGDSGSPCATGGLGCVVLYELRDNTWVSLPVHTPLPSARANAAAAYDPVRDRVVVFGGYDTRHAQVVSPATTWEWDGTLGMDHDAWTELAGSTGPAARFSAGMTYDARDGVIVLFGGTDGNAAFQDTWEWSSGQTWTKIGNAGPPAVARASLAYDPGLQQVILYDAGETWAYAAHTWTHLVISSPAPPVRDAAALTYDPTRGHVMMFGGQAGTQYLSDLWELAQDPVSPPSYTWRRVPIAGTLPPGRISAAFVASTPHNGPAFHGLVLSGGLGGPASGFGDTWFFQYRSTTPDEDCTNGIDDDGDQLIDGLDPDCM